MTIALFVAGIAFLLIGWAFVWLNLNSPIQTPIPVVTVPIGIVALLLALWRALA